MSFTTNTLKLMTVVGTVIFSSCATEPIMDDRGDFDDIKQIVENILDTNKSEDGRVIVHPSQNVSSNVTKEVATPKRNPAAKKAKRDTLKISSESSFPVEVNQKVVEWIRFFSVKERDLFSRYVARGEPFRETITKILRKYHVPEELYYLAMIESGFVERASSHAGAVGFWQFIRGTAKRYDLRVGSYVDERLDPIRSTEAAARYLKDLYNIFNSWYLAMAAYNSGEQRVLNAIIRGKSRNYWTLVKKKVLPRETMNYVPKFIAALILGQNKNKFGFKVPNVDQIEREIVSVPGPIHLKTVAKYAGVSYKHLRDINPNIRRGLTPRGLSKYDIWVPTGKASTIKTRSMQRKLARYRVKLSRSRRVATTRGHHRVRRGENLSVIASRHKMSVSQLKRLNGLRSSKIYVGQKLKVQKYRKHKVRRGESLYLLAKRFGVSVRSIKRSNGLTRNTIYPGETLKIF